MDIVERLRGVEPCKDLVALRNDAATEIERLRRNRAAIFIDRIQQAVDDARLLGASWAEIIRALNKTLAEAEKAHIAE